MDSNTAWERFQATGAVESYLDYCRALGEERAENAAEDRRIDNKGERGRRK